MKIPLRLVIALFAFAAVFGARAASVTSSGYTNAFGGQPLAVDWSTISLGTGAGDYSVATDLSNAVLNVVASSVTTGLTPDGANPPAAGTVATWSSTGFYVQTRPTGNGATLLMCTLSNRSGANAAVVTISYDFTQAEVLGEQIEGHLAFYSTTGTSGSWIPIPEFSSAPVGRRTANLNFTWPNNGVLYVAWADDNATPATPDTAMQIDNFSVTLTPDVQTPAGITADPQSITVNERTASSFSVSVGGNPTPTVQWYTNNVAVSGATNLTYNIASTPLHFHGYQIKAVAQNVASNVTYMATSAVAVLSVTADSVAPVLLSAAAAGFNQVVVAFSEQLAAGSATNLANYSITGLAGNITISNALLDASQTNVILTTSSMTPGANYVLTVNGVTDQSAAANAVAANSQAAFSAAAVAYTDIGNPVLAGSVNGSGSGINVSGGGTNISGAADQFTFAYQLTAGDFDIKVRLNTFTALNAYALAGLMARETLTPDSRFAAAMASPSFQGSLFMQRTNTGANMMFGNTQPVNYPNTWLRLTRVGNSFVAYTGFDGQNWVVLGSNTLALPTSVYVGQAVCAGNTSQLASVEFRNISSGAGGATISSLPTGGTERLGPSTRRSGLVITEIMYNPRNRPDSNNLAFIEIYNSDIVFQDISGFRITGDVGYTFPPGTILQAGTFAVVAASPANLQSVYGTINGLYGPYTNALSRSGGTVRLRNNKNAVIAEVNYETEFPWPLAADGSGHSLVLARPSYGEGDPRAWAASDLIGGSPGRAESISPELGRGVVINEFLARTVAPAKDFIELYNQGSTPVDISGYWLSDSPSTNKFRIPNGTTLNARSYIAYDQDQLGFQLDSEGDKIFLVNSNQDRVLDAWLYEAQADGISTGRYPDGSDRIQELSAPTAGTTNAAPLQRPIVINEIMYDPISGNSDDEFIELYNRGNTTVNIGGWRFIHGIDYSFPSNTFMPAGAYYVVAKNRTRLLGNYPSLNPTNVFGNFDGSLANGGERVALAMSDTFETESHGLSTQFIIVNEVTYESGGRWSQWAHGRGSSLELIDAHSDNREVANWADSDESAKSDWITINHIELTDHVYPVGTTGNQLNELQVFLLGLGEALVDDIEVHAGAFNGPNLVANGNFSTGTAGWLIQGNHVRTGPEPAGVNNPTPSMHIRASGGGDNGANRVETDLTQTLVANTTNSFTARARWLRGHREILFRLHGGGMEKVVALPVPTNLGTPGERNSRAVTNAGPAISGITHSPVLPAANQAITVTATVRDPDGVAQVVLRYRNDTTSATVNNDVVMNDAGVNGDAIAGDGIYSGVIPGQAAGNLVAFHIRATDNFAPAALAIYPDAFIGHECLVRFGETTPPGSLGIYRMWMTASNMNIWASREKLSNQAQEGTFVYGTRVIHFAGARYRGSPFIRPGYNTPTGSACAYVWSFPDDDLFLGTDECNMDSLEPSGRDSTSLREITSFNFVRQLGLPFSHQRFIHVIVNGVNNTSRGIPIYTDTQQPDSDYFSMWFPDNDDGDIYKIDDWFEFDDTPGMQNNKSASLQNFTTVGGVKKQARYRNSWEKKFNGGYTDDYSTLFDAVNVLNSPDPIYVQQVEGSFNIENWMTVFAIGHTVGDWDRYGYNRGKNTFTYRPRNGKFEMLVWDLDFSIGCTGGHGPTQDLFTLALGGDTGSDNMPEVSRLYNHPHFRRIYLRALQRIANGPLQVTNYMPTLDARYNALLANAVVATSPYVGSGAQGISLPAWIDQRRAYILTGSGLIPNVAFSIPNTNITTSSNQATISGTAPVNIKTILVNGVAWPVTWTSTTAWSIRVALSAATNLLNVVGLDIDGNAVTITNTVTAVFTGTNADPVGQIVINEIMYNPSVPDAEYVELFNTSSNYTFDLSGWQFNGLNYTFPAGSFIAPRSFLVLTKSRVGFSLAYGLSVPAFGEYSGTLQGNGETIALIRPGATTNDAPLIVDRVRYENGLPWPIGADGTGSSYQLLDVAQENARAGNWFSGYVPAVYCCGGGTPQMTNDGWRFVKATGTTPGGNITNLMRLCTYLGEIGSALIDDVMLVPGTNAGVGTNYVINGDFETPLTNGTYTFTNGTVVPTGWTLGTNYSNSEIISDLVHTGAGALKEIGTFPGSVLQPSFLRSINQILAPPPLTNAVHTMSFWFWATNSATNLHVRIINSGGLSAAPGNNPTNINITITPSNYIPPQLVSPATNYLSPAAANQQTTTLPAFPTLWINEVQAENLTGIFDNQNEREPWIEIYNTSTNTVSLDGLYLSGNYTNQTNWAFPPGSSIGPTQFLVVFCDAEPGETAGNEYHTSFRLPAGSGSVSLARIYNNAAQTLDYVNYDAVGPDRSYGSFPDGQPFDRQEFFYVTPRAKNDGRSAPLVVKINEWLAGNATGLKDPADLDNDDWFELYNPGTNSVDLAGYYLTDVLTNKTKFLITTNMAHVIPAHGYLLVWADNETGQNLSSGVPRPDMHVNFQLARTEAIGLFAADGTAIDTVNFTNQVDDVSEGRCPDGGFGIITMPMPTPRTANVGCGGVNTPPTLDPIGNKVLYIGQTLSFTAHASDTDLPAQSLTFSLDAGAPVGATIGSGTGIFSWTPGNLGSVNITVRVTDSGAPAASDSETINVEVIAAPGFSSSVRNGNNLELTWGTRPGKKYAVDYTVNLNAPITWTPVQTNTAAGNSLSYTNSGYIGLQKFFRIRAVD